MAAVRVDIDEELIELIAERAAELIGDRAEHREADGWLRGADKIAAYIDAPRSRVYALVSARRIPVHHDGSALIARRSELDRWLVQGWRHPDLIDGRLGAVMQMRWRTALATAIVAPSSRPSSPGCAGAPYGPRLRLGFRPLRAARFGGCQSRGRVGRAGGPTGAASSGRSITKETEKSWRS